MIRDNIDLYKDNFMLEVPQMVENGLQSSTIERIMRVRDLYTHWRQYPSLLPKDLVNWSRQMHPELKQRAAYDEVQLCKQLIGAFEEESKEWKQWFFNQQIMKVYEKALQAQDYKSAEKALADYAKFNKLDKDNPVLPNYDIEPTLMRMTSDPRVIGLTPMSDYREKQDYYIRKFSKDAVDADFEEVMETARESGELREDNDGSIS